MKHFFDRLMQIGLTPKADSRAVRITGVLNLLCFFMSGFFLFIILIDLATQEFTYAGIMAGVLGFVLLVWLALSKGVNHRIISMVTLVVTNSLVIAMVATGGIENSAVLWISMLPPLALFLVGLKGGLIAIFALTLTLTVLFFYPSDHLLQATYSLSMKIRTLLALIGVSAMAGAIEHSRDKTQKKLESLLTQQQRAEAHRQRLEEQLRESKKMAAVGQLAGGIAHDFNNLLTTIISHADFISTSLPRHESAIEDVNVIMGAADRAANLTTQLLAFSRQQVIKPKILNLNDVVSRMIPMFGSTLNRDIDLVFRPHENLGMIKADRRQVEMVIHNLSLNARDALVNGGQLVIETDNVKVSDSRIDALWDAAPGEFISLAVGDTGVGIPKKYLNRLYEPFFTTKKGEGSGLGLSTVYGVVKQNAGFIEITSKPNVGTVVKVFWPRVYESIQRTSSYPTLTPPIEASNKHILLVEDDEMVRRSARRILLTKGYQITEAESGENALQIISEGTPPIDLLLSDVIMTGMTGVELAEQLVEAMPLMPVVLMSGYSQDAVGEEQLLAKEYFYLQKPFTRESLLGAIEDKL